MFIYDLLSGHIPSPVLLSIIEFNITNHRLRNVPFHKNNYSSKSFFPRALKLANVITVHVDCFFMSRIVFNRNVYLALNSAVN